MALDRNEQSYVFERTLMIEELVLLSFLSYRDKDLYNY